MFTFSFCCIRVVIADSGHLTLTLLKKIACAPLSSSLCRGNSSWMPINSTYNAFFLPQYLDIWWHSLGSILQTTLFWVSKHLKFCNLSCLSVQSKLRPVEAKHWNQEMFLVLIFFLQRRIWTTMWCLFYELDLNVMVDTITLSSNVLHIFSRFHFFTKTYNVSWNKHIFYEIFSCLVLLVASTDLTFLVPAFLFKVASKL